MSKLKKFDAAEYLDTPERLSPPHNSTTRAMAALGTASAAARQDEAPGQNEREDFPLRTSWKARTSW